MTKYRCRMQLKYAAFAAVIGLAGGMISESRAQTEVIRPPTSSPQYKRLEFESKENVKLSY